MGLPFQSGSLIYCFVLSDPVPGSNLNKRTLICQTTAHHKLYSRIGSAVATNQHLDMAGISAAKKGCKDNSIKLDLNHKMKRFPVSVTAR